MAFPSIRSQITDNATAAELTHTVSLPATIVAGDIILVAIRVAVAGAIGWPDASWNELFDDSPDGSDDQQAAAWKIADGTEGGTTISVTSGSGKFISIAIAVQDASWKIPPFVGTPGTGTSPNEPDPGDCNPAVGAKDYLWWTVYSMEGEQTGITAYPANYTLNQSGIVTTGAGGATSTNCTGASAARQLNAASENAGAWDITGTLINWTARTIAFTPADPIQTERLTQPTNFPTRLPHSLASLTLGVNLLQTTLAPIPAVPNNQYDWPNPAPTRSQIVVDINSRPQDDADKAFIPIDWRNPDLRKQQPVIFDSKLLTLIEPPNPFFETKWPNPAPARVIGLTWSNNNLQNTLKPLEAAPFYQTEWPNPAPIKSGLIIESSTRPQDDADIAFNQKDWPNPLPKKPKPQDWIYLQQKETPPNPPFIPVDYPNPLIGGKQNVGFTVSRPQFYEDIKPFHQDDWPLPVVRPRTYVKDLTQARPQYYVDPVFTNSSCPITLGIGAPGDITCFVLTGLEANPFSFNRINQDNPLPRNNFVPTHIQSRPFYYDIEILVPVGEQHTPDPPEKLKRANIGFTSPRPTYFVEPSAIPPVNKNIYPNPLGKRGIIVDSVTTPGQAPEIGIPNRQRDWPNPIPRKRVPQDWADYYLIDTNLPPIAQSTALPPIRRIGLNSSFVNVSPIQASIPVSPNGRSYFDNPLRKVRIAETWISPSLSVSDVPFGSQIVFNPLRGVRERQDWKQDRPFYYEDTIPFRQNDWNNPVLVRRGGFDWINVGQIQEVNPIFVIENANPLIGRRPTETWIINLLQSTLEPAPGETPFFQTDYPNPLIGKAGKDWIWPVPQYYVDFRGPFSQFDWPIPQVGKRNHVGYISFITLESTPLSSIVLALPARLVYPTNTWTQNALETILSPMPPIAQRDYPNPLIGRINRVDFTDNKIHLITGDIPFRFAEGVVPKKGIIAPTWIYSSISNLTAVVGEKPFSQNEWPLVIRAKSAKDLITWLGQNPQILPNIKGRVICLLSSVDEYEIESILDEFDLESRIEIYELESGENDCE